MKIHVIEDEKDIIYVQMIDISMLSRLDCRIPTSIYSRACLGIIHDKEEYIDFEEEYEIDFFNSLD